MIAILIEKYLGKWRFSFSANTVYILCS